MTANLRQWYVRWFFWSIGILDEFLERDAAWRYRDGVNLCPMMRIMFIYVPTVLLLHLVVYGGVIAVFTAVPIYFFGWRGYLATLEWVAGAAVVVSATVGIAKGIVLLLDALTREAAAQPKKEEEVSPVSRPGVVVEPRGPSFWDVLWKYLVAIHDGICPRIAFKKETV